MTVATGLRRIMEGRERRVTSCVLTKYDKGRDVQAGHVSVAVRSLHWKSFAYVCGLTPPLHPAHAKKATDSLTTAS